MSHFLVLVLSRPGQSVDKVEPPAPAVLAADGVPLEVGQTVYDTVEGREFEVCEAGLSKVTVEYCDNGIAIHGSIPPSFLTHHRPAVIAADGEPLEVGQTVWVAENGNRFHVVRLCDDGLVQGTLNGDLMKYLKPEQLTHKRPVLDADGVPIHEGDTVYLLPGEWCGEYPLRYYNAGDEMVVKELCSDHQYEGVLRCAGDGKCNCFPLPCQLTHTKPEPPDSWEKWREEFIKPPCIYCRDILGVEFDDDTELDKAFDAQVQDMERRARALAGVSE